MKIILLIDMLLFVIFIVDWSKVDTGFEIIAAVVIILVLAIIAGLHAWYSYQKNTQV